MTAVDTAHDQDVLDALDFDPTCTYAPRGVDCDAPAVTTCVRRCTCGMVAVTLFCAPHAAAFLRDVLAGLRGCCQCLGPVRPGHLTWTAR